MDRAELIELLSPVGLNLLDSLPRYTAGADIVRSVTALRKEGHSPALVAAVLTQAKLRAKAENKFGEFSARMLFTTAGLEQATRLSVAAIHAGRFSAAGLTHIADLGCGIGGDAMAMAALGLNVTAADADEITATLATYNLAPFPNAMVQHAKAEDIDLGTVDGVFLDPARRTSGHSDTRRVTNPDDYSPTLDFAFTLARRRPTGIKLGPGMNRDLIPEDAEAQWVSVDGQVVELGLWFGSLAHDDARRSALVITKQGRAELRAEADSQDAEVGELSEYIFEPNGAVIRARLIGDLARKLDARMLSDGIAYLTSESAISTPFATGFRVIETLPFAERELKRALKHREIGTLEVKKRGVTVDPAALRTRLSLRGDRSATIILTRIAGKHTALLVERLPER